MSGPAGATRVRLRGLRVGTVRRPSPRTVMVLAAVAALVLGGWLWLRDSSLVSVRRVTVTGVSGPDAGQIRRALVASARTMTTLDVQIGQLRTAVAPYPVVKNLQVSTQFPHGMRIQVIEQIPVAAVSVDGRSIAVAADGTLLHDVVASSQLPVIPLRVPPGGSRLTDPAARGAVAVLAAAPYPLLSHLVQVTSDGAHGLVAQVRNGPSIYFGDAHELAAKWAAAIGVLAQAGSAGASYIDVTDPGRPAAGPGSTSSSSSSASTATTTGASSGSTSASTTPGVSTTPGLTTTPSGG
jgi:cell division protein FtsQ